MSNILHIRTIEEFKDVAELWQAICDNMTEGRIFQTFEWCFNAWDCVLEPQVVNELYILIWKQENVDDAVIFPFYLDAKQCLRFIMDEHSDFCDCIYVLGRNHHLAYKEALAYILNDKMVKQISLHKMDGNSEVLNYFASLAPQAVVAKENTYSWIDVAPSNDFAASQKQLRSKDKANVRAIRRKADKRILRILHTKHGDAFPETDFERLIESMKSAKCRSADFMPESLKSFCRRLYEEGFAEIVELIDVSNTAVALNFLLLMGTRRLSWIFLYSDTHASTELYVKYFYDNQDQGDFVFDFGTGGYDYKLGTFRPCMRALWGMELPLAKRARIAFAFNRLVNAAKTMVKVFLNRA